MIFGTSSLLARPTICFPGPILWQSGLVTSGSLYRFLGVARQPSILQLTTRRLGKSTIHIRRIDNTNFFSVGGVIFHHRFARQSGFGTINFSLQNMRGRIFGIITTFQLRRIFTRRFSVITVLRNVDSMRSMSNVYTIFMVLTTRRHNQLVRPNEIGNTRVFQRTMRLLVGVQLRRIGCKTKHREYQLIRKQRPPMGVLLRTATNVFNQ